ncbi:MAG: hypothetical protein K9N34_03615 [Candidatus Marinimicrobia bacterium]|nr:hypothetical protein [Candidatus Neomarinimicrobiota bacterium]MCF7839782.1 hypothetical protein [Candidatus Neomarinimicrobiota bacterium]
MISIHQLNYAKIQQEDFEKRIERAAMRDFFLERDNTQMENYLRQDLKKYYSDESDIQKKLLITLDEFVPAFLDKICVVYDQPPIIDIEGDGNDKDRKDLKALLEEVGISQVFSDNLVKMKLHNTILAHVKYNEPLDRIYVENGYNVGTAKVWELPTFHLEPKVVAYPVILNNQTRWIVWDRLTEAHYWMTTEPKWDEESGLVIGDKYGFNTDSSLDAPDYWPWVIYRYRRHNDFWGNGMDSLVALNRVINVLLTVVSDDSVRQTIRILILGFNPNGTPDTKGSIKTGMEHPIYPGGNYSGANEHPSEILQATLFNEEIVQLVEGLSGLVASLHNVDNFVKRQLKQDLSGIAIRLKNEPLMRSWANDIMILRKYDLELVRNLVQVHNYHRPEKTINESILDALTIDYQQPQVITDEKAEFELEVEKWRNGVSNPVDYILNQNPEMSEKQAREYIRNNLKEFNDLFGLSGVESKPGSVEENINQ